MILSQSLDEGFWSIPAVFLNESTNPVDLKQVFESGQTVMEILKDVACKPDRTVIVVTHDNRMFHFGDRIVSMSDGRIEKVEDRTS